MIIKKLVGCCIFLLLYVPVLSFAEDPVIEATITPFFNALKSGDVGIVKQHIADPLYSEIEVRLNAQEYPEFLRKYYSDSYIDIISINDHSNNIKTVVIDLYYSSNEKQSIELELHKLAVGGWKITKQTEISE